MTRFQATSRSTPKNKKAPPQALSELRMGMSDRLMIAVATAAAVSLIGSSKLNSTPRDGQAKEATKQLSQSLEGDINLSEKRLTKKFPLQLSFQNVHDIQG